MGRSKSYYERWFYRPSNRRRCGSASHWSRGVLLHEVHSHGECFSKRSVPVDSIPTVLVINRGSLSPSILSELMAFPSVKSPRTPPIPKNARRSFRARWIPRSLRPRWTSRRGTGSAFAISQCDDAATPRHSCGWRQRLESSARAPSGTRPLRVPGVDKGSHWTKTASCDSGLDQHREDQPQNTRNITVILFLKQKRLF